ncbi:MAG: hypothetical protein RR337_10955 [Clostridia bacterium]
MNGGWKKARRAFGRLHLTDKCLLAFMLILFVQTAHNLFFHELAQQESSALDVIVRTTMAAIFGYLISANFQNGGKTRPEDEPGAGDEPAAGGKAAEKANPMAEKRSQLQILVVAAIGILALLLLLIAHNHFALNDAATATISQLRDFVSGSVGFLIGHSTHQK